MKFIKTKIEGVWLMEPIVHRDGRGFFLEFYEESLFRKHGIRLRFVQDNHSASTKGVLRGLHYQTAPHAQAKLIRVIRGSAFDVVVDLRKNSKTFGWYVSQVLSAENKKMLFVPEGFAHGFLALEDGTEFLYKCSDFYHPRCERGLRWDDPNVKIRWPKIKGGYLLSDRDKRHPFLNS